MRPLAVAVFLGVPEPSSSSPIDSSPILPSGAPKGGPVPTGPLGGRHAPAIRFIFLTLLLDVLGIGLIIPVAPKLVQSLQAAGGGGGTEAEASPIFGLLSATYSLMLFVFAPILGSLSDRVGRRPVILISLLGSGLDYLAMALAPSLAWLFVTRAINGISGANMSVASAYIADITPPHKRAGAFGMLGAAFGIGFVLGPLMGGALAHWIGPRAPFVGAAILTLLNWLYGYFVLPESHPMERRRAFSWSRAHPFGAFRHLRRYPVVVGLFVSSFLVNVAQFALQNVWVLYTGYRYGWKEFAVGASLAVVGVGAVIVQGFLARKLIPRLGEARSLLIGLVIGMLAYLGYGLATHGWMIYAIIAVASIGAIAGPALQAILSRAVPATEQGELQGAGMSLTAIASILGAILGSELFAHFIAAERAVKVPGAPFFASAILSVLALANAVVVLRRMQKATDDTTPGA